MKVTRSRIIEDTSGDGALHTDLNLNPLPVRYRLTVEVEQVKAGDEWLDGTPEITATIEGFPQAPVIKLVDDEMPMVLYLADGRRFDCVMRDYTGRGVARGPDALRSADR